MAGPNPLTKFPLSISVPGSASPNSPNRPLQYKMPVVKYSPVGTIAHAPHMQLTPIAAKQNFIRR